MTQLRQQNVEPIAPEPGTPFDPNQHQAILQQPTDKYDQPTVTQLLQKVIHCTGACCDRRRSPSVNCPEHAHLRIQMRCVTCRGEACLALV